MQASTQDLPSHDVHAAEAHHHEPGFWSKYIFSTDHKVIGIQYGLTALCFLLFGFCLMICMRWQIANPGKALPIVGHFLETVLKNEAGGSPAAAGVMSADLY